MYKYTIRIRFRNEKVMTINSNQLSIQKDPEFNRFRLWFDEKPQLKILSGQPNVFREGEYSLHNCAPVKENLFEYFPDDWDKDDERFNVIDEVIVNTKGINVP